MIRSGVLYGMAGPGVALLALAVIAGLLLCLAHAGDADGDLCLLLATAELVPLAALFLVPMGDLRLALALARVVDVADLLSPPPER